MNVLNLVDDSEFPLTNYELNFKVRAPKISTLDCRCSYIYDWFGPGNPSSQYIRMVEEIGSDNSRLSGIDVNYLWRELWDNNYSCCIF